MNKKRLEIASFFLLEVLQALEVLLSIRGITSIKMTYKKIDFRKTRLRNFDKFYSKFQPNFNTSKLTQITNIQIAKLTTVYFYIITGRVFLYYLPQGNFYII